MYIFRAEKTLEHIDKFNELKRLSQGLLQLFLNQVVGKMLRPFIPLLMSLGSRVIDIRIFFRLDSLRGKDLIRFLKNFSGSKWIV